MSIFEKKKIVSFERVFWRISGMRVTFEYEIVRRDDKAEIYEYEMRCITGGGMERCPERSAIISSDQMIELLNTYEVIKWDGFHGKHPRGVLDGDMFSFEAVINDGETIHADGSANFPKRFREFCRAVYQLLDEDN